MYAALITLVAIFLVCTNVAVLVYWYLAVDRRRTAETTTQKAASSIAQTTFASVPVGAGTDLKGSSLSGSAASTTRPSLFTCLLSCD